MTLFSPSGAARMLLVLLPLLLVVGCQREEIRSYQAAILPAPKPPFEYELPIDWLAGPPSQLSILTLQTDDVGEPGTLTVTPLSGAAGGLLENVNRWRGQAKLGPLTTEQLNAEIKQRQVGGLESKIVEIHGAEKSILGAIVSRKEDTLFIKFTGPPAVIRNHKAAFDQFLGSVKFAAGGGANDGK